MGILDWDHFVQDNLVRYPADLQDKAMRMTLNYGDVPAWIASVGTVAAISVALFQIRTERKLRQKAEREDQI